MGTIGEATLNLLIGPSSLLLHFLQHIIRVLTDIRYPQRYERNFKCSAIGLSLLTRSCLFFCAPNVKEMKQVLVHHHCNHSHQYLLSINVVGNSWKILIALTTLHLDKT